MASTVSPEDQRLHFLTLLRRFRTAMLVTLDATQQFHSRPMAIARVDDDGRLWFLTAKESAKVHEIENDQHVHLTAQEGQSAFLSISGRADLLDDRAKVGELWKESFRVWFPGGKDDPNIELISVRPQRGEFWDSTGQKGARYLWESAKAYVSGTTPDIQEGDQHGVVRM